MNKRVTLRVVCRAIGLAALLGVVAACQGSVREGRADDGDSGEGGANYGGGGASGSGGSSGSDGQRAVSKVEVPRRPLQRLTRTEYNNTIRELLGDASSPGDRLPSETAGALGFLQATDTSDATFGAISDAAETLSATATGAARFTKLLPCSANATPGESCARTFVADFGRRAFRRPLTEAENADFLALYQQSAKAPGGDFVTAIRTTLEAFLQSPEFLYHRERSTEAPKLENGAIKLGSYELASRLSYFIWSSMPDEALLTAAAQGQLNSAEEVRRATERLLDDPKAAASVTDFFSQLLDLKPVLSLEKAATQHPEWTNVRKEAAYAEAMRFITYVALENKDDKDSLATMFTAPFSFVNEALAPIYGLSDVRGSELRKVNLPQPRAGILTQAAFLASHAGPADGASATPIKRGRTIRSSLLCQAIPPPQANIVAKPSSGATTRERLSEHASDPGCASCHSLMDPPGFAFENYDVTGAFRTKEGNATINATGMLNGLEAEGQVFNNAVELVNLLAKAPELTACVAQSFVRFANHRQEVENEAAAIVSALPKDDRSLRALIASVATSRGFTHRAPDAQEKP